MNNEKEEVRVFNVWSCLWLVSCDTLALQWLAVASSLTHLGRKEISDLPTTYYYLPRYWRALYLVRRTTSIIHIHIYIQHTHTLATHLNTANYLCFDGDLGFVLLVSLSVRFFLFYFIYFIFFSLSFLLYPDPVILHGCAPYATLIIVFRLYPERPKRKRRETEKQKKKRKERKIK